ncbi:putative F-box protein PP2-B12 [Carex littledalei]|uniref:Putative F-box protein PP2-B12 n=1 Tax=Carex littledalei TaxID=544730 RepID=A0A833RKG0_9POAL|nr:putative F-box protein PP2-B12 [Carex littledalei]
MNSTINSLPEDCLCRVISLTSPRDAYNFSLASTRFRSVVDFDTMWKAFLPSNYAVILSRTVDPVMFTSKKDLFFKLSESHVLIDEGTMSFGLERSSGAKCYMISANLLKIFLADAPHFYWRRISFPDSRFREVAMRTFPSRLDIVGKINGKTLSSKIRYGAYLVYKLTETCEDISYTIGKMRQRTSVTVGTHVSKRIVFLEPFYVKYTLAKPRFFLNNLNVKKVLLYEKPELDNNIEIIAKKRNDGWIEVEMGTFYIDKQEDGESIQQRTIDNKELKKYPLKQSIHLSRELQIFRGIA